MKSVRPGLHVFCAFCRSPRRLPAARRIGLRHFVGSALASVLTMAVLWREGDPRILVIFVVYLAVAEIFVQMRWRMSLSCPHCGFDPVTYKKNVEAAVEKVRVHLLRRKEDPRFLLAQPLHLPTRRAESPVEASPERTPGRLVSRQI